MFDNIGGKIKGVAVAVCWLGIIGSAILAIFFFVSANELSESYSRYTSYDSEIKSLQTSGWVTLIAGPLASWIGSLTLYGFGEAIEQLQSIRAALSEKKSSFFNVSNSTSTTSQHLSSSPSSWKCRQCNQINPGTFTICDNCGNVR